MHADEQTASGPSGPLETGCSAACSEMHTYSWPCEQALLPPRRDWMQRLSGDRLYVRPATWVDTTAWALMGGIVGYVVGAR
jgi:hypothetical protein